MRIKRKHLFYLVFVQFIILFLILVYIYSQNTFTNEKPAVLVIDMTGELTTDTFGGLYSNYTLEEKPGPTSSSTKIVNALQQYENDDHIKAFIIEIDSNGGSGIGEEEIALQIWRMKKPVVAVVRDQALSAGYYVASSTERIYANELSNIGDIGILKVYDFIDKTTNEPNVCYVPSVKYKNIYSNDCSNFGMNLTEYKSIIRALKYNHDTMVYEIAHFRNLSYGYTSLLADGSIYRGREALNNGLIDEIGDTKNATEWLEKQLGTELEIVYLREIKD